MHHNHIVPTMWKILDASHSQIAMIAVPILLQSITLAHGSDIMWRTLDRDFLATDWRTRFTAVEKTTLLLRFLTEAPVKKSQALRSCLAHAFCHLIASMDDISPQVNKDSHHCHFNLTILIVRSHSVPLSTWAQSMTRQSRHCCGASTASSTWCPWTGRPS